MERVIFLCVHNSARSQMAEGLARARCGDRYQAFSAGSEATSLHPLAVRAMAELDIDIAGQRSKRLDELAGERFDVAVTVCEEGRESCPIVPGAPRALHWDIADAAAASSSEEERLQAFRAARDEIAARLEETLGRQP